MMTIIISSLFTFALCLSLATIAAMLLSYGDRISQVLMHPSSNAEFEISEPEVKLSLHKQNRHTASAFHRGFNRSAAQQIMTARAAA